MSAFGVFSEPNKIEEIKKYLAKDAVILDVRTDEEWDDGHTESAQHIILNYIPDELATIKSWEKPVIAVCRSGARSEQATGFLKNNGVDVINGGPWQNVDQFVD